jgi:iron(III) transport system substrate-binding protein
VSPDRPAHRACAGLAALTLLAALPACTLEAPRQGADGAAGQVNVYSHRHYPSDQELFRRFTEQTGIAVNVTTASADELITRLQNEGAASPADLLITVDAGRLHRARELGLLQRVHTEVLERVVPRHLRDPDGYWWGLTRRARVLVYHRARVDPAELSTYEALADERWRSRLVTRSSTNVYNQSLLAALIARDGAAEAERWARGVARNLARRPSGGDTDQLKAVAAGVGDVAIVNTYYLARMIESGDAEERRVAEQLAVFFPNQDERGVHVNVSAAAVTASSRNRENALRLLEFLVGEEAQRLFADGNQEYPIRDDVPWSPVLEQWGRFRADTLDLGRLGELNSQAVRMFDRVGWP